MLSILPIWTILGVALHSFAIPITPGKRNPQEVYPQGASDAVVLDLPTAVATPAPDATGNLYGTPALLGYNGKSGPESAVVKDYKLVPGQLEDPVNGLELNFNLVNKPQPIRGTSGQSGATDPGPGNSLPQITLISLTSK